MKKTTIHIQTDVIDMQELEETLDYIDKLREINPDQVLEVSIRLVKQEIFLTSPFNLFQCGNTDAQILREEKVRAANDG